VGVPSFLIMCEGTAYLDRGSAPHVMPWHAMQCHAMPLELLY
jgi:hypothetical protein